jgi:hypothetical protein
MGRKAPTPLPPGLVRPDPPPSPLDLPGLFRTLTRKQQHRALEYKGPIWSGGVDLPRIELRPEHEKLRLVIERETSPTIGLFLRRAFLADYAEIDIFGRFSDPRARESILSIRSMLELRGIDVPKLIAEKKEQAG